MNRHADWLADRHNFLKLLTGRDETGDIPVAVRVDIPNRYAQAMAPGVTDFDELRLACSQWVENWLAPELARMDAHLSWKAGQR